MGSTDLYHLPSPHCRRSPWGNQVLTRDRACWQHTGESVGEQGLFPLLEVNLKNKT